jgi:hypothetical protein
LGSLGSPSETITSYRALYSKGKYFREEGRGGERGGESEGKRGGERGRESKREKRERERISLNQYLV